MSFSPRFKVLFIILFIILGGNEFYAHSNSGCFSASKKEYYKAIEKDHTVINTPIRFLWSRYSFTNPSNQNITLTLSLFEIEDEDEWSFLKKGSKLHQQSNSICFDHWVYYNSIKRKSFSFCDPYSATKSSRCISLQVFRI